MQFDYTNGTLNIKNINISSTGIISTSTTPVSSTDVTNKAYVDAVAVGLGPKNAVALKTTAANLTALSGNYTAFGSGVGKYLEANVNGVIPNIDSTVVTAGSRILFAHNTTDADFGIYDVTSVGSAGSKWRLTRSTDCDNSPTTGEVVTGIYTLVQSGTVHGQQGWCLTTTGTITIDVTGQTWSQITAAGAGATSLDGLNDASTSGGTTNFAIGTNFTFPGGTTSNIIVNTSLSNVVMASGCTFNVILGQGIGNNLSTADGNTLIGHNSGTAINTAINCVILGKASGNSLTSAVGSTIIGAQSGTTMTGDFNTIVGYSAGNAITSGGSNIILGYNANVNTGTRANCIVIGDGASGTVNDGLFFRTTLATLSNGSTTSKIVIFNTTTGQMGGIADGTNGQVLSTNGSGTLTWSTVSGGATNINGLTDGFTGGTSSMLLGSTSTISGSSTSIFITTTTLANTYTGSLSVAVGYSALNNASTGFGNVAIGSNALSTLSTGFRNTACGTGCLGLNNSSDNTGCGYNSLNAVTGQNNSALGASAGETSTAINNCVLLGYNTNSSVSGSIAVGSSVTANIANSLFFTTTLATNTTAADTTNNYSAVFVGNTGRLAPCAKDTDVGAMTDSTTGTAGAAPYTLNATADATTNDNCAKILAELNAIRTCLRNHGLMA